MDIETSQRGYLFAGGGKPVGLGEIVRRMIQVKARYRETVNDGERTLLRGEYKYYSGKLCELRAAQTADLIVYLECAAFFGFWDVGQVDRILELLHQRSMGVWLTSSSSTTTTAGHPEEASREKDTPCRNSSAEAGRGGEDDSSPPPRLPSADEISMEELQRLLLCLPKLRKEGSPIYPHLCHVFAGMLHSHRRSGARYARGEPLSPEEAAAMLTASTPSTPPSLLVILLEVVAPAVQTSFFSVSTMVELLDSLGSLCLSFCSSPSVQDETEGSGRRYAVEEEDKGVTTLQHVLRLLCRQLFSSREQLDALELSIIYDAIVRLEEVMPNQPPPPPPIMTRAVHEKGMEKSHLQNEEKAIARITARAAASGEEEEWMRRKREINRESRLSILKTDEVSVHHAFVDSFMRVSSLSNICPRSAGIFFTALSHSLAKERKRIRMRRKMKRWEEEMPPTDEGCTKVTLVSSRSSSGTGQCYDGDAKDDTDVCHKKNNRHNTNNNYDLDEKEMEELGEGEVAPSTFLSSLIPHLAEVLGTRMIYLAVEFTPAELIPVLRVWMYGLVHYFFTTVENLKHKSPSSSVPPPPLYSGSRRLSSRSSRNSIHTPLPLSPWSPCFSPPPPPLVHVLVELIEQLRVVLGEASSFLSASEILSLFHLFDEEGLMEMMEVLENYHNSNTTATNSCCIRTRNQPLGASERQEKGMDERPEEMIEEVNGYRNGKVGIHRMTSTPCQQDSRIPIIPSPFSPSRDLAKMVLLRWIPSLKVVWKLLSDKVPALCLCSSATPFRREELLFLLQLSPSLLSTSSRSAVQDALRTRFPSSPS